MKNYQLPAAKKGDTWDGFTVNLKVSGEPLDITGATILFQVRQFIESPTHVVEKTQASGITITDAPGGQFTVNEFVPDIDAGSYLYEVQVTTSDGKVRTVLGGSWRILDEVAR